MSKHVVFRAFILLFVGLVLSLAQCVPRLCGVDYKCEAPTPYCSIGLCVACTKRTHCAAGQACVKGSCQGNQPPPEPATETVVPQEPPVDAAPDAATPDVVPEQVTPEVPIDVLKDVHTPPEQRNELIPEKPPEPTRPDVPPVDTSACKTGQKRPCYDGPVGTQGKGTCRDGSQTCTSGTWGKCSGSLKPQAEVCDGKDNDCDGKVDEEWPDLGTSCNVGKGACAKTGQHICGADGKGTTCNIKPGKPTTEVCDGLDNDCDGKVDEITSSKSCYRIQGSTCQRGQEGCVGGKPTCEKLTVFRCSAASDCHVCPGSSGDYICHGRGKVCIIR